MPELCYVRAVGLGVLTAGPVITGRMWRGRLSAKELVAVAMRFNPPPGWPAPPEGYVPPPGWQPDPSWPPAPPGWQLWVPADAPGNPTAAGYGAPSPPAAGSDGTLRTSAAAGYALPANPWSTGYGQPPAPGWAAPVRPPSDTSGWATASLVLGLLGFFLVSAVLAIIFGIHALGRRRTTLQQGRGMAIAGIVAGGAWLVLGVGGIVVASTLGSGTPTQPSGSVRASGQRVSAFSLVAGDCFDNPAHAASVTSVVQTSCTAAHNAQIFATFDVSGSILDYPGSARLNSIATSGCNARAKAALNGAMITSSMRIRLLFPLESSWISGQRTISCMIYSPTSDMRSSVLQR
jgi:hypothetical protein